jgi:hypothetical protein
VAPTECNLEWARNKRGIGLFARISPCLSVMQGYHAKPRKASLELINLLVASPMPTVACPPVPPLHHNNCIYTFLYMARILSLLALSAVAGASIIQHPLQENSGQADINNKPLISSGALESHITSENLLKRAKQLYKIAELGAEEYNHPTRVIGSKGRFQSTNPHS